MNWRLQFGDCIGRGASGSVFRALDLSSGRVVAVKQILIPEGAHRESDLAEMMNEITLLSALKHTNIVQLLGHEIVANELRIVMELCENGSLQDSLRKFGPLPENLAAMYLHQVLEGLDYLHSQGVAHRDIKSGNILTTKSGAVKLADFGLATNIAIEEDVVAGSAYWLAPEVIELRGATCASDIWSVGATAIELVTGSPPYSGLAPVSALFRIVNDDHPDIPSKASAALRHFLLDCFQKDPNLRISAKDLLRSIWLCNHEKQHMTLESAPISRPDSSVPVRTTINLEDFIEENNMDDFDDVLQHMDEGNLLVMGASSVRETDVGSEINEFHTVTERLYDFDPTGWLYDWLSSTTSSNIQQKSKDLIESGAIYDLLKRGRFSLIKSVVCLPLVTNKGENVLSHIFQETLKLVQSSPEVISQIQYTGIFHIKLHNECSFVSDLLKLFEAMINKAPNITLPLSASLFGQILRNDIDISPNLAIQALEMIKKALQLQAGDKRRELAAELDDAGFTSILLSYFRNNGSHQRLNDTRTLTLQIITLLHVPDRSDDCNSELIVRDLMTEFRHLSPDQVHCALKILHKLSMSTNHLELLELSGVVDELCYFLASHQLWKSNFVVLCLQILFSLLRLNKSRQQRAVQKGMIPVLCEFCVNPVQRQLAIPILCELIHHGTSTRSNLLNCSVGLQLVHLLSDICWRATALDAITYWLAYRDSSMEIEQFLLSKPALQAVSRLFDMLKNNQMGDEEPLFRSLQRLVFFSLRLSKAMIRTGLIRAIAASVHLFDNPTTKTYILKILERISAPCFRQEWELSCDPVTLSSLVQKLKDASDSDISVIVRNLSKKVLLQISNMRLKSTSTIH